MFNLKMPSFEVETFAMNKKIAGQAPVVRRLDNGIRRRNRYPADKCWNNPGQIICATRGLCYWRKIANVQGVQICFVIF